MGTGGMVGSLLGGYMTEYYHPKYSFLAYSLLGFIVMILGINLDKSAEQDGEEPSTGSFWTELKSSLTQIKLALQMPEIYRTILFFILCAIFSPGFSEFMYFFQLDVVKLSKF
jgi:MFS-type transporter involved in bile tolerance (Atg22 family)